jgi:hypothetical protein
MDDKPVTAPVLLLDVDGVLNASKAGWGSAPRNGYAACGGMEFKIRWSPEVVVRLQALASAAEIRWATTWVGDTIQIERLLSLPHFEDAFTADDMRRLGGAHFAKRWCALGVVESGRRLIWADDEAFLDWDGRTELEAAGHLLIAPRPSRGLRPEDLDRIEEFCRD